MILEISIVNRNFKFHDNLAKTHAYFPILT